jgi:sulfatase modifying factor 1
MKLYAIIPLCFFLTASVAAAQQPTYTNGIGMEFVLIKLGTMIVGKFQPTVGKIDFEGKPIPEKIYKAAEQMAKQDALPGFPVSIDHFYYIGRFEVTQEQWRKLMGNNPSIFKNDSSSNHPVENITWNDAQAFIKQLNKTDRKHVYRLPTEFEWEYAARAGAQDDISWKDITASAVLSGTTPSRGGTMKANGWGLYDMLGNVWEWVQDFYNKKIFADSLPPQKGKEHVLKGASFTGDVKNATYMTHAAGPGNGFDIGFRVVMEAK